MIATIQYGIPVARVEFMDEVAIGAVNAYSQLDLEVAPTLFFEFHGTPAWVAEQARIVEEIAGDHGGAGFRWSADADERDRLWQARHDILLGDQGDQAGLRPLHRRHLRADLAAGRDDRRRARGHRRLLADRPDHRPCRRRQLPHRLSDGARQRGRISTRPNGWPTRLVERALAVGGTASGEHGIGMEKLKFMRAEHGDAVDVMKRIKAALDPKGIMNPGKMGDAG